MYEPEVYEAEVSEPEGYQPEGYEDGNAMAGPLGEIFAMDITPAVGRCASCGAAGPVALLRVYRHAPGWVARCPACGAVVLRLVRAPGSAWLDLTGALSLRIPMPTP